MITADQLIAHRGLQAGFPENSLLAIKKAAEAGAKHIECDIQLSSDGVFFLCHDRDLNRISGIDQHISETSSSALKEISAGEPLRFGTMYQFVYLTPLTALINYIKQHTGIHFYIELKRGALISHGMAYCLSTLANLLDGSNNITIISFDRQAIKSAKGYGINRAGVVLEHWHNKDEVIEFCNADIAYVNKHYIDKNAAITAKTPIAIYEVGNLDEAKALLKRGASMIETFNIDMLLNGE